MRHPILGVPAFLDRRSIPKAKDWVPVLEAFVPVYLDGYGNATLIYTDSMRFYVGMTAVRVYRTIARYYSIDIASLRRHFAAATHKSQSMPLVLSPRKLILIPFRARTPRYKNDGAIGYVADQCIRDIEPVALKGRHAEGIRIVLQSGAEIVAPTSEELFGRHWQVARYFHYYLHTHTLL